MSALEILPRNPTGGSRFGWHFCSKFRTCPMQWYNTYLRPNTAGALGCEPRWTGKQLLIGSMVHKGLEQWRLSGWEDGKYDLDAAIEGLTLEANIRQDEFHPDDDPDDMVGVAEELLIGYHGWYTQLRPEFPEYRVLADSGGQPLVEREFELDMGYGGYVFTARLDAVMVYRDQYIVSLETKTTDVTQLSRLRQRFQIDGQVTGQNLILACRYPNEPRNGVHLDAVVKRAKSVDPFQREPYQRDELRLEKFRLDVVRTLKEIDDHVGEYTSLLKQGMETSEAARLVFNGDPDGYTCVGQYACPYLESCLSLGHEDGWAASHTRPREQR